VFEQLKGDRVHSALGMATCAEAAESVATPLVQENFGNDAARRVPGAQKEHVVRSVGQDVNSVAFQPTLVMPTAETGHNDRNSALCCTSLLTLR
jgi:hypothetical protein